MGNYLLAFGALVIFSIFSLISNSSIVNNKKVALESEFIITATSLAQSVIEEAKNKAFDQMTIVDTVTVPASLSTILGPDNASEKSVPSFDTIINNTFKSASLYNDVDDYNGYKRIVNSPFSPTDTIKVRVSYCSGTSPYDTSGTKSFYKRMTVTVTSYPSISIPIVSTYIFVNN
jgi:hypothetical protein